MSAYNQDFTIRQGLSEQLFEPDGVTPKQNVKLELGCWYLCTDTACVYICVKKDINGEDTDSNKTLKKVNATTFEALDARVESLEQEARYVKINSELELPKDFNSVDFNPKTAYYIITDKAAGFMSLYIFDEGIQGYICTNKTDLSVLEAKIGEAIESKFDEFTDEKLDARLAEKVPAEVKKAIETQIIFGGNSTTTTDDDILN
jgi:hypothetical protein